MGPNTIGDRKDYHWKGNMKIKTDQQMMSADQAMLTLWAVFTHWGEDGWCQNGNLFTTRGEAVREFKKIVRDSADVAWSNQMKMRIPRMSVSKTTLIGYTEEFEAERRLYGDQDGHLDWGLSLNDHIRRRMKKRGVMRKWRIRSKVTNSPVSIGEPVYQ